MVQTEINSSDGVQNHLKALEASEAPEASEASEASSKSPQASTHLVAGSLAGLISAITLQPFDLLKTRLQQQQRSNVFYRTTITKELRKLTHFKDLWRGVIPSTLRTSVGAGLYFTILSSTRSHVASLKVGSDQPKESSTSVLPRLSAFENLVSGSAVRALVGVITMPITVIKARYESNMYNYNSMYEGFESIYLDGTQKGQGKGSIRNFFKGSLATLARDCPYAGLYVLFYESFKNDVFDKLIPQFDNDNSFFARSSIVNSSAAVLGASVATTITAPFDAIKTRLQLSNVSGKAASLVSITKQLLSERGGVENLFRGLSLRLGRKGLSSGISWCIYEELIKSNRGEKLASKAKSTLSS